MTEFVDGDGMTHKHIYCNGKEKNGYLEGWYFVDEIETLNGPFSTLEECEKIFKDYCDIHLKTKEKQWIIK